VLFERAALLTLGLCTELDPDMNPIHTVGPYLQEFVLGKGTDVKGQVTTAIREMAMSAVAIPDKTNRLLERANRGEVQFQIGGLRESAMLLYAAGQQVVFVFLAIAIAVLGYVLDDRGQGGLALIAWGASALCLLVVAVSMLRARALRRSLRERRKS
jgi:hypothetical protein